LFKINNFIRPKKDNMINKIKSQTCSLIILASLLIMTGGCKKDNEGNSTVRDIDGNVYNTVTIGAQTWMKENLKAIHYRNGEPIPNVTGSSEWNERDAGAYCDYDNTPGNSSNFGRLYNFYAVHDPRNICPEGWHVPEKDDWIELFDYLGGDSIAGGKLKTAGTIEAGDGLWYEPNTGATNESGFSALPGGLRSSKGFFDINYGGLWWSGSDSIPNLGWYVYVNHHTAIAGKGITVARSGFSIRCIKV
jgi:uncharacterized protein (TIGR02145 family)